MTEKRIGIGMMIVAWMLFLGLMYFVFRGHLSEQYNPNRQVKTITTDAVNTIVLTRNRNNHYVLNGKINGSTATFLLDTGATEVTLPLNLAKQLGLRLLSRIYVQTANGLVTAYQTKIDTLTMGSITLHDVYALINTGEQGKTVLLGMSALKHLTLTQRGNEMVITQHRVKD